MEIMILIAVLCFLCVFILLIANLAALANCCGKLRSLNRRLDRFELQWLLHPPPPAPPPERRQPEPGVQKPSAGPPLSLSEPAGPVAAMNPDTAPAPELPPAVPETPAAGRAGKFAAALAAESAPKPFPAAPVPSPRPVSSPLFSAKEEPVPPLPEFDRKAQEALQKIWNWISVGEEYRPGKVAVEYAVATVWLVRSAVLLLLIGIGFFVKYSHDNNLFPPQLRIAGVILLGLAVIAAGCRLSRNLRYRLLGFGLAGIGVVTLYFSIFASASIYRFLPNTAAFPLMILITVAGALLSLRLNSLFVALAAVLGGYATPVLLSTGAKQLPELFGYLLMIGAGSLFLAFYRNWRLLNFVAFVSNGALFCGAVWKFYDPQLPADWRAVVGFGSGFFVLFSVLPLLYSLLHRLKITLLETLLLAVNTAGFLWIAVRSTQQAFPGMRYEAGVTVFAALVFAAEFLICVRCRVRDRNLYLSLLTFSSLAVALTVPLLFSASWITAAWAIQAALMLYLGVRSGSRFLQLLASVLYVVAGGHAAALLGGGGAYVSYLAGLTDRLVSLGTFSLSLVAGCFVMRRGSGSPPSEAVTANEPPVFGEWKSTAFACLFFWGAAVSVFLLCRIEIGKLPDVVPTLRLLLCAVLYLGTLAFLLRQDRFCATSAIRRIMAVAMIASGCDLARLALTARYADYPALAGFRLAGFLIFSAGAAAVALVLRNRHSRESMAELFGSFAGAVWFVYSSAELYRALNLYLPEFATGGLSVFWAVYALALLVGGIRYRKKPLRMTGLALFGVVAAKAIFLDLARLPSLYRVLAFLAMGLLFFIGAFAYMRVEQLFRPRDGEPERGGGGHEA